MSAHDTTLYQCHNKLKVTPYRSKYGLIGSHWAESKTAPQNDYCKTIQKVKPKI